MAKKKVVTKYVIQVRYPNESSYGDFASYGTRTEANARVTKMKKALKDMKQKASIRIVKR